MRKVMSSGENYVEISKRKAMEYFDSIINHCDAAMEQKSYIQSQQNSWEPHWLWLWLWRPTRNNN
jgi:hypothetical protein